MSYNRTISSRVFLVYVSSRELTFEWCCTVTRGTYEDLTSGSSETKTQTSSSMFIEPAPFILVMKTTDIKFTHFKNSQ